MKLEMPSNFIWAELSSSFAFKLNSDFLPIPLHKMKIKWFFKVTFGGLMKQIGKKVLEMKKVLFQVIKCCFCISKRYQIAGFIISYSNKYFYLLALIKLILRISSIKTLNKKISVELLYNLSFIKFYENTLYGNYMAAMLFSILEIYRIVFLFLFRYRFFSWKGFFFNFNLNKYFCFIGQYTEWSTLEP